MSLTRLCESLNEIIDVSPAFSVATRGVGATAAAIALGIGLSGFGDETGDNSRGSPATVPRGWFGLLRAVAWMVTIAVVASVLIGYAALGSFLIDQAVWISASPRRQKMFEGMCSACGADGAMRRHAPLRASGK